MVGIKIEITQGNGKTITEHAERLAEERASIRGDQKAVNSGKDRLIEEALRVASVNGRVVPKVGSRAKSRETEINIKI